MQPEQWRTLKIGDRLKDTTQKGSGNLWKVTEVTSAGVTLWSSAMSERSFVHWADLENLEICWAEPEHSPKKLKSIWDRLSEED